MLGKRETGENDEENGENDEENGENKALWFSCCKKRSRCC